MKPILANEYIVKCYSIIYHARIVLEHKPIERNPQRTNKQNEKNNGELKRKEILKRTKR